MAAAGNMTRITLSFLLSMLRDNQFQGPEAPVVGKHHWSYKGPEGPSSWHVHFSQCAGKRQSPIDVPLAHCEYDPDLSPFILDHFEAASGLTGDYVLNVTNNGHAASARVSHDGMRVRGGGLQDTYKTAEFHFHWGGADDRGSEHALDGRKFPLEMHVVNYAEKYGTIKDAMTKPDGLAVLGVFFELSDKDNPHFAALSQSLRSVHKAGEHNLVDQFRLRYLLPQDVARFWRYQGSLTTPFCFESVTWTLFEEPQKISASQLSSLRSLLHEDGHDDSPDNRGLHHPNSPSRLVDNWRPLQPLYGREVKRSFQLPEDILKTPLSSPTKTQKQSTVVRSKATESTKLVADTNSSPFSDTLAQPNAASVSDLDSLSKINSRGASKLLQTSKVSQSPQSTFSKASAKQNILSQQPQTFPTNIPSKGMLDGSKASAEAVQQLVNQGESALKAILNGKLTSNRNDQRTFMMNNKQEYLTSGASGVAVPPASPGLLNTVPIPVTGANLATANIPNLSSVTANLQQNNLQNQEPSKTQVLQTGNSIQQSNIPALLEQPQQQINLQTRPQAQQKFNQLPPTTPRPMLARNVQPLDTSSLQSAVRISQQAFQEFLWRREQEQRQQQQIQQQKQQQQLQQQLLQAQQQKPSAQTLGNDRSYGIQISGDRSRNINQLVPQGSAYFQGQLPQTPHAISQHQNNHYQRLQQQQLQRQREQQLQNLRLQQQQQQLPTINSANPTQLRNILQSLSAPAPSNSPVALTSGNQRSARRNGNHLNLNSILPGGQLLYQSVSQPSPTVLPGSLIQRQVPIARRLPQQIQLLDTRQPVFAGRLRQQQQHQLQLQHQNQRQFQARHPTFGENSSSTSRSSTSRYGDTKLARSSSPFLRHQNQQVHGNSNLGISRSIQQQHRAEDLPQVFLHRINQPVRIRRPFYERLYNFGHSRF